MSEQQHQQEEEQYEVEFVEQRRCHPERLSVTTLEATEASTALSTFVPVVPVDSSACAITASATSTPRGSSNDKLLGIEGGGIISAQQASRRLCQVSPMPSPGASIVSDIEDFKTNDPTALAEENARLRYELHEIQIALESYHNMYGGTAQIKKRIPRAVKSDGDATTATAAASLAAAVAAKTKPLPLSHSKRSKSALDDDRDSMNGNDGSIGVGGGGGGGDVDLEMFDSSRGLHHRKTIGNVAAPASFGGNALAAPSSGIISKSFPFVPFEISKDSMPSTSILSAEQQEHHHLHHRLHPTVELTDHSHLHVQHAHDQGDVDEELVAITKPLSSSATVVGGEHRHRNATAAADDIHLDGSFCASVQDRAGWLVGLLVLQSMSSFIISRNESLLQEHIVIVQFLTMLVGAGGNAGNQASVRVIRGLATGSVNNNNLRRFLIQELKMACTLSFLLGVAGSLRATVFAVPLAETLAITTSLCSIVFISIVLGAILPLGMKYVGIDPAHSSTTIQVIMDIVGVLISCHVSRAILDSAFHKWLLNIGDD